MNYQKTTIALLVVTMAGGFAWAQHWDELGHGGGDAGIQTAAQEVTVGLSLTTISGSINTAGGDHVDCYAIRVLSVSGEAGFYATSDPAIDPNAVVGDADTRLWIWDATGTTIISGNDDSPGQPGFLSVVADPIGPIAYAAVPTNPVTTSLVAGGQYIVCYSYYANDPDDAGGVDLVDLGTFEALNGPNPAAGAFAAYEDPDNEGPLAYTLAFQAAGGIVIPVELMSFTVD